MSVMNGRRDDRARALPDRPPLLSIIVHGDDSASAANGLRWIGRAGQERKDWERLAGSRLCPYYSTMDEETANRIIDLQAEITALRGAVRMLLHNTYNANDSALAILREKAFQTDRFQVNDDEPNERSARYREGVREAVASLLDPFQPDSDEASRLANPAPTRVKSSGQDIPDPDLS